LNLFKIIKISAAAKFVGLVSSFLISILIANSLGQDRFGEYIFIISIITLASIPVRAGTTIYISQFFFRNKTQSSRVNFLDMGYLFNLIYVVFLLALLLTFNVDLLIALIVFFIGLVYINKGFLRGIDKNYISNIIDNGARPFVYFILIIVVSQFSTNNSTVSSVVSQFSINDSTVSSVVSQFSINDSTVSSFMVLLFLSYVICSFFGIFEIKKYFGRFPDFQNGINFFHTSWVSGLLPFSAFQTIIIINAQLVIVISNYLLNSSQVAVIAIGLQFGLVSCFLTSILSNTVSKYLIIDNYDQSYVNKARLYNFIFGTLYLVFFIVFGKYILTNLYGPDYVLSYYIALLLIVTYTLIHLIGPVTLFLNINKFSGFIIKTAVISLLMTIILSFLLFDYIDSWSTVVASVISLLTLNLINYRKYRAVIKTTF
jgi:O-antigen/teichoic acid export membrane protein